MKWHITTLSDVLAVSNQSVEILDHRFYRQVAVQSYPKSLVVKGVKSGLDFPKKRQRLVLAGQFMISKFRAQKGFWGIVSSELDGAVAPSSYLTFDLHPDLDADYFATYLSTRAFKRAIIAASPTGGRLYLQHFKSIRIPLPPSEDQRQIAEVWQYGSAVLRHTAEMIASISDLKLGVGSDLFRNANPSWERKTLSACAAFARDTSIEYPLVVVSPDQILSATSLPAEGGIGIIPKGALDAQFLWHYLQMQKPALQAAFGGSKSGSDDALKGLSLPLPTLYEQRKITAVLQQHDEALARLRAEQTALRRFLDSLMHLVFTDAANWQDLQPALRNFLP
jgi:hypothetical protein